MKNLLRVLVSLLLVSVVATSFAQSAEAESKRSGDIIDKVRELDLMNHILPIIWTKPQLNALLPAIEKVRKNVKDQYHLEYGMLLIIEPDATTSLNKALDEGNIPGQKLIDDLERKLEAIVTSRKLVGQGNEELVFKALDPLLNAGQKKAMANSLNPQAINPELKNEKMTEEEKIKFYIRNILLDPLAYDLLVKVSRSSFAADK